MAREGESTQLQHGVVYTPVRDQQNQQKNSSTPRPEILDLPAIAVHNTRPLWPLRAYLPLASGAASLQQLSGQLHQHNAHSL